MTVNARREGRGTVLEYEPVYSTDLDRQLTALLSFLEAPQARESIPAENERDRTEPSRSKR